MKDVPESVVAEGRQRVREMARRGSRRRLRPDRRRPFRCGPRLSGPRRRTRSPQAPPGRRRDGRMPRRPCSSRVCSTNRRPARCGAVPNSPMAARSRSWTPIGARAARAARASASSCMPCSRRRRSTPTVKPSDALTDVQGRMLSAPADEIAAAAETRRARARRTTCSRARARGGRARRVPTRDAADAVRSPTARWSKASSISRSKRTARGPSSTTRPIASLRRPARIATVVRSRSTRRPLRRRRGSRRLAF